MNYKLLLIILRSRLRLVFFTMLITLITAAVITAMQPKRFIATASLLLSFEKENPFERGGIPAQLSNNFISTQLDIIRSRKVAMKVVEILKLEEEPELQNNYLSNADSEISIRNWLALTLMPNLTVEPLRDSRVVNINYRSLEPQRAAEIADAFAQAYIETTLEMAMEPARRNAEWFDEQLQILRVQLDEAQAKLTNFQQEKGIVALDEKLGTETGRLNDISSNLVKAQDQLYDVRSRQLGQNHPEYRRARERERSLRDSLDNQKQRILELKNQRDELASLAREVEIAQQTYEATLQSFYETSMESQFNQTSISILNYAIPPQKPSSPNVALNMLSALFLSLGLSIVLAIATEILNRRVRNPEDVQEFLNSKVIATV